MSFPLAQDPDELFDIVTAEGLPTGRTKRRADVHRDGDWHRAIHIWVYGVDDGDVFVLMQQRGLRKDTNPGMLDPTVSGHLGAGEHVEDAYREMEEEIGMVADPSRLRHIGVRPRASEQVPLGIIDRELQDVFLYRDDRPLDGYKPNPAELEALVRLPLSRAIALFAREVTEVPGTFLHSQGGSTRSGTVDSTAFATAIDRYYLRAALAIAREIRGERYNVL